MSAQKEFRIVIVDDHPLFRQALSDALNKTRGDFHIVQLSSIREIEQYISDDKQFDLLIMDLHMPDSNGYSGYMHIAKQIPDIPTLIISAHDDQKIINKLKRLNASGFVSKSANMETINIAINTILDGDIFFPCLTEEDSNMDIDEALLKVSSLTQKQYQVFHHCATGMLNKQIAYELGVTEATIKAHLTTIMRKLGLNNRTQIALLANRFQTEVDLTYGEHQQEAS